MDVLQETRRNKIEDVTRFCHKLIRYVREFIDDDDLEVFGRDKAFKVMMMESIEEQEFGAILKLSLIYQKAHQILILSTTMIKQLHQQFSFVS